MAHAPADVIDDVIRDLDLLTYRLERPLSDLERARVERTEVRVEIERLKECLGDLMGRL